MKDKFEEIAKEIAEAPYMDIIARIIRENGRYKDDYDVARRWVDAFYPVFAIALKRVEKEGFERGRVSRETFRSIMCEYVPSIAEDSGQPEWSQGELDKAYDDVILGEGVWSKINERSLKQGGDR
jgi:hypothetical protein